MNQAQQPTRLLLLMRHAHALPLAGEIKSDHARPLSARGETAATQTGRALAELLRARGISGSALRILCSSAKRTQQTCTRVTHELRELRELKDTPEPEARDSLYSAAPREIFAAACESTAVTKAVLIIAHEPTISAAASLAADSATPEAAKALARGMSPGSCAVIETTTPWNKLRPGKAHLTNFLRPI